MSLTKHDTSLETAFSETGLARYIFIDQGTAEEFGIPNSDRLIGDFSKVNIFVGKNNSGKSRFLRKLFSSGSGYNNVTNTKTSFILMNNGYDDAYRRVRNFINSKVRHSVGSFETEFSNNLLNEVPRDFSRVVDIIKKIRDRYSFDAEEYDKYEVISKGNNYLGNLYRQEYDNFINILGEISFSNPESRVYIPILRGLRPINITVAGFTNSDVYSERTKFDYFPEDHNIEKYIYTGLSMYEDVKKLLLGLEEERKLISDFEKFLEDKIFHEKVTLIPKHDKDVLNIKIGETPQREIYNLGDGLQTIITILFPAFINQEKKSLVFIDEPETHLHPYWQTKLLDALISIPNQQYFITTHSAIFVNNPTVKVFNVRDEHTQLRIEQVYMDNQRLSVLKDLGYRQSDLLQTNYILWVEGPSDKVYLEYWIKQLAPNLSEGTDFTILLYGGGNYKHIFQKDSIVSLDSVKSINRNFGIILDSDKTKENDVVGKDKIEITQRFEDEELFNWTTSYREIENYIPISDFELAVKQFHKKEKISIEFGKYDDRNEAIDLNSKTEYKGRIKIPQSLMTKIQKGKGKTANISEEELRNGIEAAIAESAKATFGVNKIEVAKCYVSSNPEVPNGELKEKLMELIVKIGEANHIEI